MGKLKRFLLRYEPPGIGLEIEEGGSVQVVHKDLAPNSEVHSGAEIKGLVANIIADEPGLLSSKRHKPALIQLLHRLYQIDLAPDADTEDEQEASAAPKAAAQAPAGADPNELKEGMSVVVIGLQGKQQVYNGEIGQLVKVRADKDKYEVKFPPGKAAPEDGDDPVKVKGKEHIVPVANKGGLAVGTHVVIRGLRNHVELNGCLGRVVECHTETHRFEVRATESGQLFRVKQENLVQIDANAAPALQGVKENQPAAANMTPRLKKDVSGGGASSSEAGPGGQAVLGADGDEVLEPGTTVQLTGLKTAMCYNGQSAEVLSVDRVRCRYEIRLGDGSVKTIRAENVRKIPETGAKSSPRGKKKDGGAAKPAKS